MEVMQFGSYNSGLVRAPSTADDPTDEVVGNSAGEYAGKQATERRRAGTKEYKVALAAKGRTSM